MVTTIITAMAAYSNKRVAAIVLSVLYRMLTFCTPDSIFIPRNMDIPSLRPAVPMTYHLCFEMSYEV